MKRFKNQFNEWNIVFVLCIIFFLRIFGMVALTSVIPIYGMLDLTSNDILIGISIGIYGVLQACFQIPMGIISDLIGRKRIIIIGLFLFLLGNIIGVMVQSIIGLIISRAVQGSGAVASTIMALISDVVQEKNKFLAMFLLGVSISTSFILSLVLGPMIFNFFGFYYIFWINIIFTLICIFLVYWILPSDFNYFYFQKKKYIELKYLFQSIYINIIVLLTSIFFLNFFLTLNFMLFPKILRLFNFDITSYWKIYFKLIFISFLLLIIFRNKLEKNKFNKSLLIYFVSLMFITEFIFWIDVQNKYYFFIFLQFFFLSFISLEALLPSLIIKLSSPIYKGGIMSLYSTSQFFGSAMGGSIGGFLINFFSLSNIVLISIIISIFWCCLLIIFYKTRI